jgi:hypothetical protein
VSPVDVLNIDEDPSPTDPECLHCYLAPVIQKWSEDHPLKDLSAMVLEVAEVLGELAASDAVDCDAKEFAQRISQVAAHMLVSANEMRQCIARKLAKDAAAAKERSRAH